MDLDPSLAFTALLDRRPLLIQRKSLDESGRIISAFIKDYYDLRRGPQETMYQFAERWQCTL